MQYIFLGWSTIKQVIWLQVFRGDTNTGDLPLFYFWLEKFSLSNNYGTYDVGSERFSESPFPEISFKNECNNWFHNFCVCLMTQVSHITKYFYFKKQKSNGTNIAYSPLNCTYSSQVFERNKTYFCTPNIQELHEIL